MGKNKNKFDFDASNFLSFVLKKFKTLLVISLLAAVISAIASLFIHNKYKSSLVMFPTSAASTSKSLLNPNYSTSKNADIMGVGEDEDVDKLLQVLNSGQLKSMIIQKFDLIKHYKINISSKGAYTKLYKKLDANIKFSRTQYNSVLVEVWDEEPVIAANMANEIAILVDTVFNNMNKERAIKAYNTVKTEYESETSYIRALEDTLAMMGKAGLYDLGTQGRELNKAYYNALFKGRSDLVKVIKKQLDFVAENAARYNVLREFIGYKQGMQHSFELKLREAKIETEHKLPYKFVVDYASVADSKDSPKRMIIVLVSAITAFFVALFGFIIMENIKKLL